MENTQIWLVQLLLAHIANLRRLNIHIFLVHQMTVETAAT